jgi:sialate O-acetylesterase
MKRRSVLVWLLMTPELRAGELSLHPGFADGMVVQAGQPLPVFGSAPPGVEISLSFRGHKVWTQADRQGSWRVVLPPLSVDGTGSSLRITADGATREIRDVLTGEVWLCAGQSNLEFPLRQAASWAEDRQRKPNPFLRLCDIPHPLRGAGATALSSSVRQRLEPAHYFAPPVWRASNGAEDGGFSAVAWHFGQALQESLQVPVGLIQAAVGGSPAEAWMDPDRLATSTSGADLLAPAWLDNPLLDPWCRQRARAHLAFRNGSADPPHPAHPYQPGFLFRALFTRLGQPALRGVVWYQGESNALDYPAAPDPAWRVHQHESLFPRLLADWRRALALPTLPFLVCQLSAIRTNHYASAHWPEFRDQQRRLVHADGKAALVVTSDLGDPHDVHPRRKREVGLRLATAARHAVYRLSPHPCHPEPLRAERQGQAVFLHFRGNRGGWELPTRPADSPFELGDAQGRWQPAPVSVVDDHTLRLCAADLDPPTLVRHAWQPFPLRQARGGQGQPVGTFRLALDASNPQPK